MRTCLLNTWKTFSWLFYYLLFPAFEWPPRGYVTVRTLPASSFRRSLICTSLKDCIITLILSTSEVRLYRVDHCQAKTRQSRAYTDNHLCSLDCKMQHQLFGWGQVFILEAKVSLILYSDPDRDPDRVETEKKKLRIKKWHQKRWAKYHKFLADKQKWKGLFIYRRIRWLLRILT